MTCVAQKRSKSFPPQRKPRPSDFRLERGVLFTTGLDVSRREGRRSHEICQDLTDCRRDHNPRVGGSSPSSATKLYLHNQALTPHCPPGISLSFKSGVPFGVPKRSAKSPVCYGGRRPDRG